MGVPGPVVMASRGAGQARWHIKQLAQAKGITQAVRPHPCHPTPTWFWGAGLGLMEGGASTGSGTRAQAPPALAVRRLLRVLRSDGIMAQGGIATGISLL